VLSSGGHQAHLCRQFLERAPWLFHQGLAQDLAVLGFGGSAMLGCAPL